MRGLRSSSTREAFSLIGDNLYNPAWGYQNGKVRSGRIRREFVPLTAVAWQHNLSPSTRLDLTFTAETGIRQYSSLAWYNARTPVPDNYREMPGYFTDDPATQRALEEIWRAHDPRYTQIDWITSTSRTGWHPTESRPLPSPTGSIGSRICSCRPRPRPSTGSG